MLIVVSPAKKLNMDPINSVDVTEPIFKEDVKSLINIARDLSSNATKRFDGD